MDTTTRTGQIGRSANTNNSVMSDETKEQTTMNETTTVQPTSRRRGLFVALFGVAAAIAIAIVIAAFGGPRIDASTTQPAGAVGAVSDRWYVETRNQPVQRDNWYLESKVQRVADASADYRADRAYFRSLGIVMATSVAPNDSHQREMNRLRDINEAAAPSANASGALAPQRDTAQRTGPF